MSCRGEDLVFHGKMEMIDSMRYKWLLKNVNYKIKYSVTLLLVLRSND